MPAGAVVCLACGFNGETRRVETVRTSDPDETETAAPTFKERWKRDGMDAFIDWELPVGLIAISFLFITVAHLMTAGFLTLPKALFATALLALVEAAWMYAGMCFMELMKWIEFGTMGQAMLKLMAITSVWLALGVAMEWSAPGIGWMAHGAVGWPIELFLVRWLFSLDSWWSVWTMIIIVITQAMVTWLMPGM